MSGPSVCASYCLSCTGQNELACSEDFWFHDIATNAIVLLPVLSLTGMELKFDRSPTKD